MSWEEQSEQRKKGAGRRSQGMEGKQRERSRKKSEWEGSREEEAGRGSQGVGGKQRGGSRKRKEAGKVAVS